eukprot:TRINITY_DN21082_c0_g2_i1.p2 TRINITY_DN21082_c0_g2~~TRINITY_DN21082_c0_g2_i1.p2  ORF type:complete len:250 (+),score=-22.48 TRINITY_DN21082_c0_g2_i1:368-1117(+)
MLCSMLYICLYVPLFSFQIQQNNTNILWLVFVLKIVKCNKLFSYYYSDIYKYFLIQFGWFVQFDFMDSIFRQCLSNFFFQMSGFNKIDLRYQIQYTNTYAYLNFIYQKRKNKQSYIVCKLKISQIQVINVKNVRLGQIVIKNKNQKKKRFLLVLKQIKVTLCLIVVIFGSVRELKIRENIEIHYFALDFKYFIASYNQQFCYLLLIIFKFSINIRRKNLYRIYRRLNIVLVYWSQYISMLFFSCLSTQI